MFARRIAGGLAVLLLASAAQAGPITWGFVSEFESVGGHERFTGRVTTGANIHEMFLSQMIGVIDGPHAGSRTVNVGALVPNSSANPIDDVPTSYRFRLRLTDHASGESGEVVYTGRAGEDIEYAGDPPFQYPISRHAYVYGLTPATAETLTLGGNEYRVSLSSEANADGNAYLDATVTVGEVHETPEPATLALAGVGIAAGVGAWWRRRK